MKRRKLIIGLILITVLAVFLCALICGCTKKDAGYVRLSEIKFPENLNTDELFGLFFINRDGTVTNSTESLDKINYDPEKPLLIFIHGMQYEYGYYRYDGFENKEGVLSEGYNYGVFVWSQASDMMPFGASSKIWGRDNGTFTYKGEDGQRLTETEDTLKLSIAEYFVAYYMSFMERAGFSGSQIVFTGHSLGANTMTAISSCMLTLAEKNYITKEYLPDRIVLFDAYWECLEDNTYVPWLGRTIGQSGVFGMVYETMALARKYGISTEYIKSSSISFTCDAFAFTNGLCSSLYDNLLYLDLSCEYAGNSMSSEHVQSFMWYMNSLSSKNLTDYADDSGQWAYSARTPVSVTYARNGTSYSMSPNYTKDVSDDIMRSTNIHKPKVAGFAFNDVNKNGINDDRIKNRVSGVKVELYLQIKASEVKIAETTTDSGGYYEFSEGLVSGVNYRIKVLDGSVGVESDGGEMNNGIKSDGYSDVITVSSDIDLKIVNIGLNK